jgi:F-type H+-transporting ATPase subunit delta
MRLRSRAAERYARALYSLADESQEGDAVARDLATLRRWNDEVPEFRRFLPNRLISGHLRAATLEKLLAGWLRPLTWRFIRYVESRRRLALLPEICDEFDACVEARAGILRVQLTLAQPIGSEPAERIAARLGQRVGKKVLIEESYDPGLLGGYRLRIGDTVHDFSLQAKLRMMKDSMLAGAA